MNDNTESPATPEDRILARYLELGRIAKAASDERDAIKETELLPMMLEDGIQFSFGGQYLRFEYAEKVVFDHKRARAEGKISDDVWREYSSVNVERKLMVRAVKDETQLQTEQQILTAQANIAKGAKK